MPAEVAQDTILWVIAGMAVTNFVIRFTPISILSRFELPDAFKHWLSFVPVSVMGALVAAEVIAPRGSLSNPLTNPGVWASGITMIAFRLSRSFLGATLAGIVSFVLLRGVLN